MNEFLNIDFDKKLNYIEGIQELVNLKGKYDDF